MSPTTFVHIRESIPPAAADEQEADIRVDKILDIRRQLGEGRYSIADKLDVVIDRLLEEILK